MLDIRKIRLLVFLFGFLKLVNGVDLGFRNECSGLSAAQILTDAAEVISKAGQTVNKFEELIHFDEELQQVLNNSIFTGVILVPENSSIIRYQLPSTQEELVDQFKLFVIPGGEIEGKRMSLQGSEVIMSQTIVANQFGVSVEVLDIQKFGYDCPPNKNISKFEVWIISDFLPLPTSPASKDFQILKPDFKAEEDGGNISKTAADGDPFRPFVLERFQEQQNMPIQPAPPPAPPTLPVESQCDRNTPMKLFELSRYVRRLAPTGAQFLIDQAIKLKDEYSNPTFYNYLMNASFEGVILVPNEEAIDYYQDLISGSYNDSQVALMHIIPGDLNQNVLGPIEVNLLGDLVKLGRDREVANSEGRSTYIDQIDQVGRNCEQFEFWILKQQPLLPPYEYAIPQPPRTTQQDATPTPTPSPPPTPTPTPSPPPTTSPPPPVATPPPPSWEWPSPVQPEGQVEPPKSDITQALQDFAHNFSSGVNQP